MLNFKWIAVLLYTFSWISSIVTQFYAVEVQAGEEVTLECSNFSRHLGHITWFKMTNRPNVSRISSMIKHLDSSDSGLYFCGEYKDEKTVISSGTYLKVQDVFDGLTNVMPVILGSLIVLLLLVIIGLAVQLRKFHSAQDDGQNPQQSENVDSDDMNYAALNFHPKAKIRRPVPQSEMDTNVVYASTKHLKNNRKISTE
ncbi:uncharacterized protein LOC120722813 isoform X2 [Simochromis diagramma]|uniref:uncharacterized protein LOC120722813 isoform X2 n=1 Tax=Simochromis diagramma TaxID=43689 RepID=UPI001A7E8C95|nr:uncharacterized protein LOC120722813 isoform X2 [Simochromis diagramma]